MPVSFEIVWYLSLKMKMSEFLSKAFMHARTSFTKWPQIFCAQNNIAIFS